MHSHGKKLYGTATVGTKGQIVIPADAREELAIEPGDRLYVLGSPKNQVIGLVKEEQLREFIDNITNNVEFFKDALDTHTTK
jgi:AbrB family looped-hinge helix DNA binding protein